MWIEAKPPAVGAGLALDTQMKAHCNGFLLVALKRVMRDASEERHKEYTQLAGYGHQSASPYTINTNMSKIAQGQHYLRVFSPVTK